MTRSRIVIVLSLVIAGLIVGVRYFPSSTVDVGLVTTATPSVPSAGAGPAEVAVARGEMMIDPRRQQLVGVRTTTVERSVVAAVVHTTGVVRADETRQTDINVRVDGWIRELF